MGMFKDTEPKPYTGGLLDPIRMPATMSGGRQTVLGQGVNRDISYPHAGTIVADRWMQMIPTKGSGPKLRNKQWAVSDLSAEDWGDAGFGIDTGDSYEYDAIG